MSKTTTRSTPAYTPEEAHARATFEALMWAFSYPGRVQTLPDAPNRLALIGDSLLDLETTCYTPDNGLAERLKRSGARLLAANRAAYQFYPVVDEAVLVAIATAPVGTPQYPDEAATLVLGCTVGAGRQLSLRGPGIPGLLTIHFDGIPDALWRLRAKAGYPLGWDLFLVDSSGQLIGLPRTTRIREFEV